MKIINFIFLCLLAILASCGSEEIEKLGKTDCAVEFTNYLDQSEDDYQDLMLEPDSEGNQQSLEACLQRRLLTEGYLIRLYDAQPNNTNDVCTLEERDVFNARMWDRIHDLEEDMESTWNRCEEVYGGG